MVSAVFTLNFKLVINTNDVRFLGPTFRYLSTWFIFDVCSTAPFQTFSLLFTNNGSELGFRVLNMLRLWRLRRVSSLFARFIIKLGTYVSPFPSLFFLAVFYVTLEELQYSYPSLILFRLEKDIRFNYFWTRCTKLVSVSC